MAITETVTIINNSGKVVSTGKQLVNIFKEAKAAYRDKKDALKAERAAAAGIKRAQTFDVARGRNPSLYDELDGPNHYYICDRPDRRLSYDDGRSIASSRTHRSHKTHRRRSSSSHSPRPALTESNLRAHSEVSTTAPSAAPRAYQPPYAETASRPTLAHAATTPAGGGGPSAPASVTQATTTAASTPGQSMLVHRHKSETALRKRAKDLDLDLAYGNIPPDLGSRTDLDSPKIRDHRALVETTRGNGDLAPLAPVAETEADSETAIGPTPGSAQAADAPRGEEDEARSLMQKIEDFLDEAQCIHHSATHIISHLQSKPEAAAAVALTLAELSALLAKLSPAFLGAVKAGSPAVFALLASPQFLIGAGVAVGVTVVMFGGWKIVKHIQDGRKTAEEPIAFEMQPQARPQAQIGPGDEGFARGAALGGGSAGFDEALVLEEELSSIESWRRGIVPFGEDETADMELISPEAEREARRRRKRRGEAATSRGRERVIEDDDVGDDDIEPDDSASRCAPRTPHRHHRGHHDPHRSGKSHRDRERAERDEIPERRSSKGFRARDRDHDRDDESEVTATTATGRSERSHRSRKGSSRPAKRADKAELRVIEEGRDGEDDDGEPDAAIRKDKKGNMLKTLLKKIKEKDGERRSEISVLV